MRRPGGRGGIGGGRCVAAPGREQIAELFARGVQPPFDGAACAILLAGDFCFTETEVVAQHDCGALYDCVAPSKNMVKPAGEWNHMTITALGPVIQVELNGEQIVDANLDEWTEPKLNPDGTKNKFKTAYKDMPREGHIGFHYHGSAIWFRNIKIKTAEGQQ